MQIENFIQILACAVNPHSALYVSSPLTTGGRATEWHSKALAAEPAASPDPATSGEFRRQVVDPNRQDAARFVLQLRQEHAGAVIDPGALNDVPHWHQDDYRSFWGRVIQDFAIAVLFRQGWEASSGCAYEFAIAVSAGLRLLEEDLRPMSASAGARRIRRHIEEADPSNRAFLEAAVAAVEQRSPGGR